MRHRWHVEYEQKETAGRGSFRPAFRIERGTTPAAITCCTTLARKSSTAHDDTYDAAMSPPGGGQLRTFRSKPKSGWTPVSNKDVAQNYALSLKAKGLLLTLLSQPDGGGMTTERLAHLHKTCGGKGEGEHAIREAMKELRAAGLVTQTRAKGDRGRWVMTTAVSDTPEGLLLLKQLAPTSDF